MIVKPIRILFGALPFLALAVSQPAVAQITTTLQLLGPPGAGSNNAVADNIYLSPYYFSVGGSSTPTQLICDDFADDIYQNETWTANVYTGSLIPDDVLASVTSPTGTSVGALGTGVSLSNLTVDYEEIGYLADLLLTPPTPSTGAPSTAGGPDQAALSFAIWSILDPSGVTSSVLNAALTSNEQTEYTNVLIAAANAASTNGAYYLSGLTVYQPVTGSQTAGDGMPQQFVTFSAPEVSSSVFLAFDLLVLFAAVYFVRRRSAVKSR